MKVIGSDANALYLWALAQLMPTDTPISKEYKNGCDQDTINNIVNRILNDELFGFVELDIYTPDHLKKKFSEFTPIFKNQMIEEKDIGDYMREHVLKTKGKYTKGRKLIGSYFGEKITLYTPLIKWYLEHGLIIKNVYQTIEYKPSACFSDFADTVSNARRNGDINPNKAIIAETQKLIGNSGYGKTIEDVFKHSTVKHCDIKELPKFINKNFFRSCENLSKDHYKDTVRNVDTLGTDIYEVDMIKSQVRVAQPIQIGLAVYSYAKLKMLSFYYDFLDKYIDRADFEMIQMDTDSAYCAFSSENIENLIKPELKEEYMRDKYNWFPSESNDIVTIPESGTDQILHITRKQFDKRTPGLMKEEARLDFMIALCSKMYYGGLLDENGNETGKNKYSSKGLQHNHNVMTKDRYYDVLFNGVMDKGLNKGFQIVNNSVVTYELNKSGLTFQYDKRQVLPDGVSTIPLEI